MAAIVSYRIKLRHKCMWQPARSSFMPTFRRLTRALAKLATHSMLLLIPINQSLPFIYSPHHLQKYSRLYHVLITNSKILVMEFETLWGFLWNWLKHESPRAHSSCPHPHLVLRHATKLLYIFHIKFLAFILHAYILCHTEFKSRNGSKISASLQNHASRVVQCRKQSPC